MGTLTLDGVRDFQKVMHYCKEKTTDAEKKDLYFRATVIVQAALCLIKAIVLQVCRAMMHFAACDLGRAKEGARDIASAAVQFVALPLLGITAAISPVHAKGFIDKLANHDVARDLSNGQLNAPCPVSATRDQISRGVGGAFAIFAAFTDRSCHTLSKLLARDWEHLEGEKTLKHISIAFIFSATLGTCAAFGKPNDWNDPIGMIYHTYLPRPQPDPFA